MSAFPATSVPSSINTIEKLVAHSCLAYQRANPSRFIEEDVNFSVPMARCEMKRNPEGKLMLVSRVVILLDESLVDSGSKVWNTAIETPGGAVIPSAYTTN